MLSQAERATPYVVVDAVTDDYLIEIGEAVAHDQLVTGAAVLAGGRCAAISRRIGVGSHAAAAHVPSDDLRAAVLAGSCSARTLEQVAHMRRAHPSLLLDALAEPDLRPLAAGALECVMLRTARPIVTDLRA